MKTWNWRLFLDSLTAPVPIIEPPATPIAEAKPEPQKPPDCLLCRSLEADISSLQTQLHDATTQLAFCRDVIQTYEANYADLIRGRDTTQLQQQ